MAKRTARTVAWSVLLGLVAARFVSESVPLIAQALVGVGAAVGTDWFMRWREGRREQRIEEMAARADQERDERLGRGRDR